MDMNYVVSFLEKIVNIPSPSGYEGSHESGGGRGKGLRLCGRVQQERRTDHHGSR